MNYWIMLALCIAVWTLTSFRFRGISWQNVRQDNGVTLNMWLSMFFFSITTIFLVKTFCDYFNSYTLNNLDRLISYSSLLFGLYCGACASTEAVGMSRDKLMLRWLIRPLLVVSITGMILLYSIFLSRIPNINHFIPRSPHESVFMLIAFLLAICLCLFIGRIYVTYLPSEQSAVMRIRAIWFIAGAFAACSYFVVKAVLALGYFWPIVVSAAIIDLSWILLILTILIHLTALHTNKLYVRFVLISRYLRGWKTFQELNYLGDRLRHLCPEVAIPVTKPSFFSFLLNPEYHIYRALIGVMDGKTMLDDVLMDGALQGEPTLWEGDMLREAVRVKQALQAINPSGDFWKVVHEYRSASRGLQQRSMLDGSMEVV